MRSTQIVVAVVGLLLVGASTSLAQYGRPAPPPRPPVVSPPRPPVMPPRLPSPPQHVPGLPPNMVRQPATNQFGSYRPLLTKPVAEAASVVGLLGSPLGEGPLLAVSVLFLERTPVVADAPVVAWENRPVNDHHPRPLGADPFANAFWIFPLLLGAALVIGVGVAISRTAKRTMVIGRVRIVKMPPGEVPEEIRQAWIGLELPIVSSIARDGQGLVDVLSNQPVSCGKAYAVDGAEAVRILATAAPDAAAWWRTHAPQVLSGGYQLVFPAEVCERID
jgi:hypothetical protein